MSIVIEAASALLLVAGGGFCVIGGVGVLRMPDFYTRVHAASVCDNVGALLVLAGLMLLAGWSLVLVKLVAIALLILFTSPVATHALARAALGRGLEPQLAAAEGPSKP
jgi:multicomponent Na+:H+ antiporter subunit G